jgi:hypothetical protein
LERVCAAAVGSKRRKEVSEGRKYAKEGSTRRREVREGGKYAKEGLSRYKQLHGNLEVPGRFA